MDREVKIPYMHGTERKFKKLFKLFKLFMLLLPFGLTACSAQQLPRTQQGNIQPFESIYEPSGIVYVGESEFLLVEDEPEKPIHRLKLDSKGYLDELGEVRREVGSISLNDLEGISYDGQYVYAITSHSIDKKSELADNRAVLVRYRYRDGMLLDPKVIRNLKQQIALKLWPLLAGMSINAILEEINIEALAWYPPSKSLYIGFRAPLAAGKSLVISLSNPDDLFASLDAKKAHIELKWLDLDNNRIRAMSWDAIHERLLMVTGRKRSGMSDYVLWAWSGMAESPPIKIGNVQSTLPARTEGLSTFKLANANGVLIVLDDGSRKKGLPGHYQLIWGSNNTLK